MWYKNINKPFIEDRKQFLCFVIRNIVEFCQYFCSSTMDSSISSIPNNPLGKKVSKILSTELDKVCTRKILLILFTKPYF